MCYFLLRLTIHWYRIPTHAKRFFLRKWFINNSECLCVISNSICNFHSMPHWALWFMEIAGVAKIFSVNFAFFITTQTLDWHKLPVFEDSKFFYRTNRIKLIFFESLCGRCFLIVMVMIMIIRLITYNAKIVSAQKPKDFLFLPERMCKNICKWTHYCCYWCRWLTRFDLCLSKKKRKM